jgi:hypothetical protein
MSVRRSHAQADKRFTRLVKNTIMLSQSLLPLHSGLSLRPMTTGRLTQAVPLQTHSLRNDQLISRTCRRDRHAATTAYTTLSGTRNSRLNERGYDGVGSERSVQLRIKRRR